MIEATPTPEPLLGNEITAVSQGIVTPVQALWAQFVLFVPTILVAILIFVLFWFASSIAGRLIQRVGERARLDLVVRKLLQDGTRLTILAMGVVTALGTLGIDVSAMVAGLGLTSLALGLALKDVVSNVVSGVLILMYHPFRVGDTVNVTGSEGVVIDVNLRYTVLRGDGKIILIPNQSVFSNVVIVNKPIPPA